MVNYNTMPSVGRMAVMATSFLGIANAHMFMKEPKPFEGYAAKDPLDKSGSNFPCQGAPLNPGGQKLTAGGKFDFTLDSGDGQNTAVHGGGSCQLSITYETDSEKAKDPKNWQVIYSIEGGCPANAEGNLDPGYSYCESDGEAECLHKWQIPVPKGVKSGDAILAWTWQNTIGNREFYMNCAPVTIEGGSGDEEFPAMFVANMASVDGGECETTAYEDVLYPEPGEYVTTMSATAGKNWPKSTPTGQGCKGGSANAAPTGSYGDNGSSGSGSSGSSESAPSATSAPAYGAPSNSAPAYSAPAPSSQIQHSYTQQKGRQTATTLATSASKAPASSASAPASYAAPAPTGYSSSTSSESNTTSSGDCEPCDEDGALICIGDDSFGICDHSCAVPRALSAGTVCTDGVIASAKKNRFARRHAHFGAHKH